MATRHVQHVDRGQNVSRDKMLFCSRRHSKCANVFQPFTWQRQEQNAEAIWKTYKLFICGDITNSFRKHVLKTATP
jgi:hypothetical protein